MALVKRATVRKTWRLKPILLSLLCCTVVILFLCSVSGPTLAQSVFEGVVTQLSQGSRVQTLEVKAESGRTKIFYLRSNTRFVNLAQGPDQKFGIVPAAGIPVKVVYTPDGSDFGSALEVSLNSQPGTVYSALSRFLSMDFIEFEREARVQSLDSLKARYPFFSRGLIARFQKNLVTKAIEPFAPRIVQVLSKNTEAKRTRVNAESYLWSADNLATEFFTMWSYLLIFEDQSWCIDVITFQAN